MFVSLLISILINEVDSNASHCSNETFETFIVINFSLFPQIIIETRNLIMTL